MLGKAVKLALEVVGVLLAGVIIAVVAFAWRLTTGPISLDFARGLLQEALTLGDLPVGVEIGEPVLTWKGWGRVFDVTVKDVRLNGYDGALKAEAPTVLVRLSVRALADGLAAPVRITVNRPRIQLSEALATAYGDTPSDSAWVTGLLAELADPSSTDGRLSYLRLVDISGATLETDGIGPTGAVTFRDLDATLTRHPRGLQLDVITIAEIDGAAPRISLDVDYRARRKVIGGSAAFTGLPFSSLARLAPRLADNVSLSTPADGGFTFEFEPPNALLKASGTLEAANGTLGLPALYPKPLPFDTVSVDLGYDATTGTVKMTKFILRDGAASASATAQISDIFDLAKLTLRGSVKDVPGRRLDEVWPPILGVNARTWAVRNLEGGTVPNATLELDATVKLSDPRTFRLTRLGGTIEFSGVTAHYFKPLPPAVKVAGRAEFDTARFDIDISEGHLDDVQLAGSELRFFDIDTDIEKAEINIAAQGSVSTALEVLGHDTLKLAQRVGFDPGSVVGQAGARIRFAFPLTKKLTLDMVRFAASANLQGVGMPGVVHDQALTDGRLTLDLNRDGMRIAGDGRIAGLPVFITQDEVFSEGARIRRRKQLKTSVDGERIRDLGLPALAEIEGPVTVDAEMLDLANGFSEVSAVLDLRDAQLAIPALRWTKPRGAAGRVRFSIDMDGAKPRHLKSASLIAADLGVDLSADFAPRTGALRRVYIDRLVLANSSMSGNVEVRENGSYHATLSGSRLDIRRFMDDDVEAPSAAGIPFSVNARFDEILIGALPPITATLVDLRHDGTRLSDIQVAGRVDDEPVTIDYVAQDDIKRFELRADDAGRVLRGFEIIDSIAGGRLTIAGTITGRGDDERTLVNLSVDEFGLIDAPVLAQVLNAAFLVGLVDTLQGKGIRFERLNAEIAITKERAEILDALAYGASLGVSASGGLDRINRTAGINGMIVPAYGLSRLIDQIPILGRILTGGEKEGLLAAEYRIDGSLDRPTVTVNPLTALTPGFLRALVKTIGDPTKAVPADPEQQQDPG